MCICVSLKFLGTICMVSSPRSTKTFSSANSDLSSGLKRSPQRQKANRGPGGYVWYITYCGRQ
jgi:hypothetical protein